MWVQPLGQEDPLEESMGTFSSILAWRLSWTEEPAGLQSMGLQIARHKEATQRHAWWWRLYCAIMQPRTWCKDLDIPGPRPGLQILWG